MLDNLCENLFIYEQYIPHFYIYDSKSSNCHSSLYLHENVSEYKRMSEIGSWGPGSSE